MKKIQFILIAILIGVSNLPGASVQVTDLTCEYTHNPLGIDVVQPRLAWKLLSEETDQRQTAYQILVSKDEKSLSGDKGTMWDSGRIQSDRSIHVTYAGLALKSRQRYFWKVRIWDKQGQVSGWSDPAWWEMGLLNPSDWQADWISAPPVFDWQQMNQRRSAMANSVPPEQDMPAPLFRQVFKLDKPVKSARVYIAGLGYYELSFNGKKAGDHVLDPAFTRYDKRALYVTHDVTGLLSRGENVVGVILGTGWYDMPSRGVWGFDLAGWRARPVLRCQIHVEFEDGSETQIRSGKSWFCHPGPVTFNSIRQGEFYDARLEQPGWNTARFEADGWQPVHSVPGPEGSLSAQMLPPIRIMKEISPVRISTINDSVHILDFGQSMAGLTQLKAEGKAGTAIRMIHGERLSEDGRVDQRDIASLVKNDPFQTDQYIMKGEGVETWQPRFVYHGFRWIEVHGFPGHPTTENFTAKVVYTSFPRAGSFECSNKMFNQIQHNTLWSYTGNFHGYPTDCPHREKNGWTGDAHLAAETGLLNFGAQSAYTKWMTDIADEQKPSGEIAAIIPTCGWGYYWGNGPAWDNAYILIPWYLYVYSGDTRILSKHYDQMKRYVDFLGTVADQHIVRWGLGDWAPARTLAPAEITSTAYYYVDALLVSKIAGLLGFEKEVETYSTLAREIREAFRQTFIDADSGHVGDGSQTAMACALYQGMVEGPEAGRILANLKAALESCDLNFDCGILGTKYLFNVLADHGEMKLAYSKVNTTDFPGWGHWVEQGATTLWEQWDGTSSRIHVMYGDISAWFYKYLAGIRPDEAHPGFRHFFIQPWFPPDMQWVKASHESMYGTIRSEWEQTEKEIRLTIRIPVNTTATVRVPGDLENPEVFGPDNKEIRIDWKVAGQSYYETLLGSGEYRVTGRK